MSLMRVLPSLLSGFSATYGSRQTLFVTVGGFLLRITVRTFRTTNHTMITITAAMTTVLEHAERP